MKLQSIFAILVALLAGVDAFSVSPEKANPNSAQSSASVDRRTAFTGVTAATAALISSGVLVPPDDAMAVGSKGPEAFVGTYTDPINHPGGKRTIKLLDIKVGDYVLAEVQGGGGRGEPTNYVLPAAVIGDRSIIIDFSPKGGPRDFAGVLEDNGDIRFLRDGNRWPRQ